MDRRIFGFPIKYILNRYQTEFITWEDYVNFKLSQVNSHILRKILTLTTYYIMCHIDFEPKNYGLN